MQREKVKRKVEGNVERAYISIFIFGNTIYRALFKEFPFLDHIYKKTSEAMDGKV